MNTYLNSTRIVILWCACCAAAAYGQPRGNGTEPKMQPTGILEDRKKPDPRSIPELIRALDDPNEKVRSKAIDALARKALGDEGKEAKAAIPRLAVLLNEDPSSDVRESAAGALAKMDNAGLPVLIKALGHKKAQVRFIAVSLIGWMESSRKTAVVPIIGLLNDPDYSIREEAVIVLGAIKDKRAIPHLIRVAAMDNHSDVQFAACQALGRFRNDAKPAIPVLVRLVKSTLEGGFGHPFNLPGSASLTTLALIGKEGLTEVAKLAGDVNTRRHVRVAALATLSRVGENASVALPVLKQILERKDDAKLSQSAIGVAESIGPMAKSLKPLLMPELDSPMQARRIACAIALAKIDPSHSREHLMALVSEMRRDDPMSVRLVCLHLHQMRKHGAPVVPDLICQLSDANARLNAIRALGAIGPFASKALPHLGKMAEDQDKEVRNAARISMKKIGN